MIRLGRDTIIATEYPKWEITDKLASIPVYDDLWIATVRRKLMDSLQPLGLWDDRKFRIWAHLSGSSY